MKLMSVRMIDGVNARLDGLVEVAFDLYHRRRAHGSDMPKTVSPSREPQRTIPVDPPYRKHSFRGLC